MVIDELRHGYTLTTIANLTRIATLTAGAAAGDFLDRYDIAWSAIVEELYGAGEPPAERDLIGVGCNAIWRELRASMHTHGIRAAERGGNEAAPGFERFWRWHAMPVASPEERVVERVALTQILPELTRLQREALVTYAAAGFSTERAGMALAVKQSTASARVDYARAQFLRLWHEGEVPSRKWRKNGARRPDHKLVPCGTNSAYFRHWHRGEPIDDACAQAHHDYTEQYRRKGSAR